MFLIHFVLIFVYGIKLGSPFIFCMWISCMWISSFPKTIYWKKLSFPHWMMLVALSKSFGHIFKGLLWALFYLLLYLSIFMPIPHCFDYCSFLVSFKVKKCESSSFVLSFEDCSGILGPLIFHVNFRMSFSLFTKKKHHWDFDRDYIEPVACFV